MINLLFNFRLSQMFLRLLHLTILCCALSVVACAQTSTTNTSKNSSHDDEDPFALNSPQMEMLARKEIEMLETERRENLQRTQEAVQRGEILRGECAFARGKRERRREDSAPGGLRFGYRAIEQTASDYSFRQSHGSLTRGFIHAVEAAHCFEFPALRNFLPLRLLAFFPSLHSTRTGISR